jgi:phosphoribosyl 1,2-cyclic phosphodiesterase
LVEAGGTRFLVDAGLSPAVLRERAAPLGIALDRLDGVVLTHAHSDHASFADACAFAFGAPLFLTESTQRGLRLKRSPPTRVFGPRSAFTIGAIDVRPCPVPHDAPQVALVFEEDGRRAALVTDLGSVPPPLVAHLAGCGAVLVESNYDPELLRIGPYPPSIQARVAGARGHLSNRQCAELLARLDRGVREIVLVHVSENNNSPMLARATAEAALAGRTQTRLRVAAPADPLRIEVPRAPHQIRLPF